MDDLGIWLVREQADAVGQHLQARLGGSLFRAWRNEVPQKEQFKLLFSQHSRWVLVMTTGIAARFIDGALRDKHTDPAVVVLDEAGRFAVSFLGGHEAGANDLAYRVANAVGAIPVVTTATEALKPLVVGIGSRRGVSAEQVDRAVRHALGQRDVSEVREVATIALKAEEPGLLEFCRRNAVPLRVFTIEQIAARAWVTQPSEWVKKNIGVDGVCEPCALIACERGKLVVPKTSVDGVAVAVVKDRGWIES